MQQRSLQKDAIEKVLEYGRTVHTRGAVIHAIGRREIRHFRRLGVDLSALDGVQVVCSRCGAILTVYRNRDFRHLRANLGRGRFRPWRSGD